jgi:hypothetical protein
VPLKGCLKDSDRQDVARLISVSASVILLPGVKGRRKPVWHENDQRFTLFTVNSNTTTIGIDGGGDLCQAQSVENKGEDQKNSCYYINDTVTDIMFSTGDCH